MSSWLKRILMDQQGYGTVEALILAAAGASLAGTLAMAVTPKIRSVHEKAAVSITDVMSSGY